MLAMTCPNRETLLRYSVGLMPEEESNELAGHLAPAPTARPRSSRWPTPTTRSSIACGRRWAANRTWPSRNSRPPWTMPSPCPIGACARAVRPGRPAGRDAANARGISRAGGVGPRRHGPRLQGPAHQARSRRGLESPLPRTSGGSPGRHPLHARDAGCRQAGPSEHRPGPRRPRDRRHERPDHGVCRGAGPSGDRPPLYSSR